MFRRRKRAQKLYCFQQTVFDFVFKLLRRKIRLTSFQKANGRKNIKNIPNALYTYHYHWTSSSEIMQLINIHFPCCKERLVSKCDIVSTFYRFFAFPVRKLLPL